MTRSTFLARSFCAALISFSLLPLHSAVAAPVVSQERPAVVLNATVRIVDGKFGRANIVALLGGTLTIVNRDSTPYDLRVGATKVNVLANGKRTIPLPQKGLFSIVSAKAPGLRATLTVK